MEKSSGSAGPAAVRSQNAGEGSSSHDGDLFSWTVVERLGNPPALGAVGVCDDRDRAVRHMAQALQGAPPTAFGLLHKVVLNPDFRSYRYGGPLVRLDVDGSASAVVVSEPGSGGLMRRTSIFAEITRVASEAAI